MTSLRMKRLQLANYRCFESLDLAIEDDLTVLFAENGGGKTALLTALAMGLAVFQRGAPRSLKLNAGSDPRQCTLDEQGLREPAGPCTVTWEAALDATAPVGISRSWSSSGSRGASVSRSGSGSRTASSSGTTNYDHEGMVNWSTTVNPASGRTTKEHRAILDAIEKIRVPGDRWPLFAWYGVDRLGRGKASTKPTPTRPDRWEGYAGSLNAAQDDSALLTWLLEEILADTVRRQEKEPERFLASAVMDTLAKATPGVTRAWYDPRQRCPVVRFETGHSAPWQELSDGFHVFISLIADIARRAVMLNEIDGAEAPARVEGVVLIDEIDLHLHPKWQRVALHGLRKAFPRLQLIVSTHSPQVLSSAENRQVRFLMDGKLWDRDVLVAGRDTNAIIREYFRTDDRDEKGAELLKQLDDAIDAERGDEARKLLEHLLQEWGNLDPNLIRRRSKVERLK